MGSTANGMPGNVELDLVVRARDLSFREPINPCLLVLAVSTEGGLGDSLEIAL
jgi:hypothetical protein